MILFLFSGSSYTLAQILPVRFIWIYGLILLIGSCGLTYTPREVGGAGPDFGYGFMLIFCWAGMFGVIVKKIMDCFEISLIKKQFLAAAIFILSILVIYLGF